MELAPIPHDERQRLAALEALDILNTRSEEPYDALAELACQLLGTPVGFISFIGSDKQWFKAKHGIRICETDRSVSFCSHTILGTRATVVEDTLLDPRFHDNPLVLNAPWVRFYAGAPIRTFAGQPVGTVCVVDFEPKTVTGDQLRSLELLSRLATQLLEHRRVGAELFSYLNSGPENRLLAG